MKPSHIPVFDGHNDALTRLWLSDHPDPVHAFIHERLAGHLDLKRCQAAGFVGGMFAIFLPPYSYVQQHHPINSLIQMLLILPNSKLNKFAWNNSI